MSYTRRICQPLGVIDQARHLQFIYDYDKLALKIALNCKYRFMNGEKRKAASVSLKYFFRTQSNGQITKSGEAPYDPPSFAETSALRRKISETAQTLSMRDIHDFGINDMPAGLEAIANSQMPLSDIPKFYETVKEIRDVRRTRLSDNRFELAILIDLEKSTKQGDITEQLLDDARFMVAERLAYTVAFNEHLLGPNEEGVTPTAVYNLVTHEQNVIDNVENVATVLKVTSNLFGQRTRSIYEGLTGRLNRHRGMFAGYRVNKKDFPAFPQPGSVK